MFIELIKEDDGFYSFYLIENSEIVGDVIACRNNKLAYGVCYEIFSIWNFTKDYTDEEIAEFILCFEAFDDMILNLDENKLQIPTVNTCLEIITKGRLRATEDIQELLLV